MVLYIMNVTEGSAAPKNTIAEYDGKSRDCSIQRNSASGKKGTDRVSLGGGRDGYAWGNLEKIERAEVGGARSA